MPLEMLYYMSFHLAPSTHDKAKQNLPQGNTHKAFNKIKVLFSYKISLRDIYGKCLKDSWGFDNC